MVESASSPESTGHRSSRTTRRESGWEIVELSSPALTIAVIPEKGADILSLRCAPSGVELLWRTRWGLRPRGLASLPASAEGVAMEHYAGGWNTMFPNAGGASMEHGVEWGLHGEAWVAPYRWKPVENGIHCTAELVRSPFRFEKTITLEGSSVTIVETATNLGAEDIEVLWGQHPAFAAPLISADTRISTNAAHVYHDVHDERYPRELPLLSWPRHRMPDGEIVDLQRIDPAGSRTSRRAFLGGFPAEGAQASIANADIGITVELSWSAEDYPHAWYWFESGARTGFPWYGAAHVLAIEPCTSYPSQGLGQVRRLTGTQQTIAAGRYAVKTLTLEVSQS